MLIALYIDKYVPFTPLTSAGLLNCPVTYVDKRGERVSTEAAYLTADVLARSNLKVAIHTQVTKIIFEQSDAGTRAVGVEFAATEKGPRYVAHARKEVIIS